MEKVIVRYKVKPGRDYENVSLIKSVFAELDDKRPSISRCLRKVGPNESE